MPHVGAASQLRIIFDAAPLFEFYGFRRRHAATISLRFAFAG